MCDYNTGSMNALYHLQQTTACLLAVFLKFNSSLFYLSTFLNDTYLFCFGVKFGLLL
jgi:hypothetical protein